MKAAGKEFKQRVQTRGPSWDSLGGSQSPSGLLISARVGEAGRKQGGHGDRTVHTWAEEEEEERERADLMGAGLSRAFISVSPSSSRRLAGVLWSGGNEKCSRVVAPTPAQRDGNDSVSIKVSEWNIAGAELCPRAAVESQGSRTHTLTRTFATRSRQSPPGRPRPPPCAHRSVSEEEKLRDTDSNSLRRGCSC
ncbi:unnamed protein product [Pleuronectes platessa]|uniref:Uncharacterized protein n=1 Tax=Pleuronectes platessa TaxID=8262 RepID=A0A9N7V7M5_PLEPL|nr:unnamed protein product [Pleuronectes platessa]